jgi:hypothetical protein
MGGPYSKRLMPGLLCVAVLALATTAAFAQSGVGRDNGWQVDRGQDAYEAGYREGVRRAEHDGRRGRDFELQREPPFNRRDEFRRGYVDGYRAGYERFRNRAARQVGDGLGRRATGGYHEVAAARGYSDGFEDGQNDGRRGNRYDPVSSRDYREGDNGYSRSYGSRDAYRNNYRAGFRQGYEDGYRDGWGRR